MATNFYFQSGIPGGRTSENRLVESLIIESIKIYGFDTYYMPRTQVNPDVIFEEDTVNRFDDAFPLEMYLENVDGYGGDGELMQKFGIELRETATFVLARLRWDEVIGRARQNSLVLPNRPAEGDILYMPMTKSFFEIKKVEVHDPFYQLGKLHVYKLQCELWQYSSEKIDTGVEEIDAYEDETSQDTLMQRLVTEDGFAILLDSLDYSTEEGGVLMYEGFSVEQQDPLADNADFNREALDILDFTTINPFGEVATRV
jgi:hypothetical protein